MPTIQIRDVPDDVYETLRRRAKAEGKSLQSYMRDRVIEMTRLETKAAMMAAYEAVLAERPPREVGIESILADIDAGRDERTGD
jgi:antitoxin FitA